MAFFRLANVAFAYPQQAFLLRDVSLHIGEGWTGIVGPNGAGKSTLMSLLRGVLKPHRGTIERDRASIAYCPQNPTRTDQVEDFANAWSNDALKWMSFLELAPEDYWRWEELSPGTRKKWQIGAALYARPEVLFLDEPSNHLDEHGRNVLIRALDRFEGLGIVVSHDRALLDHVTESTIRVDGGSARLYPGGYSSAREHWRAEESALLAQLEHLQAERTATRAILASARDEHAGAKRSLSSRSRMTSVRDHDARSTSRKSRAENAEQSLGRSSAVARQAHQRAVDALDAFAYRPSSPGASLTIHGEASRLPRVVSTDLPPLKVAERTLLDATPVNLGRDERTWLRGPNGCGKSTLLAAVYASLSDHVRAHTLYLHQELEVLRGEVTARVREATDPEHIFNTAAALRLDVGRLSTLRKTGHAEFSPGEWRKAMLACGLGTQTWLALLDEPTNDLDIPSIEALERALAKYPGAMMLVTHDDAFADGVGASPWTPAWCA